MMTADQTLVSTDIDLQLNRMMTIQTDILLHYIAYFEALNPVSGHRNM
mgnify:FL=1